MDKFRRLHNERRGDEESGAASAGPGAVAVAKAVIGVVVQGHDPDFILIVLGCVPGGDGPLRALRQGQDVMVLAELVQSERGHLALTGAILLGAIEGGEVHGAGDDLIGVTFRQHVQVGIIEIVLQRAITKNVILAKRTQNLSQIHKQGAILTMLQHLANVFCGT